MKLRLPNYEFLNTGPARKVDAVLTLLAVLYGIYRVVSEWPEPSNWAWGMLAFGLAAVVCFVVKPADIVMNMFVRSVVKTRD